MSPFVRDLGVRERDGELELVANESHMAYGSIHGGLTASLAMLAAQAKMQAPDRGVSLHVTYPRAGRGSVFTTSTRVVRRAHELGFCQTDVLDEKGGVVAAATAVHSAGPHADGRIETWEPLRGDRTELNEAINKIPFLARRGMEVVGVDEGRLVMTMAPEERNLDADGTVHDGAVLTLMDAAGATVPWTLRRSWDAGATIAFHAQLLGTPSTDGLVAQAFVRARDERTAWSDITVSDTGRRLRALATVVFRFS